MLPPSLRRLRIPRSIYKGMVGHAWEVHPVECCGLLAGAVADDGTGSAQIRYPLVNAAASPVEYLSEPRSMFNAYKDMRQRGIDVLAVYHSHPASAPVPSKKDLAQSYGQGILNLILSLMTDPPMVRGWWLQADSFEEAEWSVVEDANSAND